MFVKSLVALSATSSALVVRRNLGYNTAASGEEGAGVITAAAHNLNDDDVVYYTCGGTGTGASAGCQEGLTDKQLYVVDDKTTDTFRVKKAQGSDAAATGAAITFDNSDTSSAALVGASTNKFTKMATDGYQIVNSCEDTSGGCTMAAADKVAKETEYLLYCSADAKDCVIGAVAHGGAIYGHLWDGATALSTLRTGTGAAGGDVIATAAANVGDNTTHRLLKLTSGTDKVEVSPVAAAAGSGSAMRTLTMFGTGVAALAAVFMA